MRDNQKVTRPKIDWPVACAFVLIGCMMGLSGQDIDNPSTLLLFAVFLIAFAGLGIGLLTETIRRKP